MPFSYRTFTVPVVLMVAGVISIAFCIENGRTSLKEEINLEEMQKRMNKGTLSGTGKTTGIERREETQHDSTVAFTMKMPCLLYTSRCV